MVLPLGTHLFLLRSCTSCNMNLMREEILLFLIISSIRLKLASINTYVHQTNTVTLAMACTQAMHGHHLGLRFVQVFPSYHDEYHCTFKQLFI